MTRCTAIYGCIGYAQILTSYWFLEIKHNGSCSLAGLVLGNSLAGEFPKIVTSSDYYVRPLNKPKLYSFTAPTIMNPGLTVKPSSPAACVNAWNVLPLYRQWCQPGIHGVSEGQLRAQPPQHAMRSQEVEDVLGQDE